MTSHGLRESCVELYIVRSAHVCNVFHTCAECVAGGLARDLFNLAGRVNTALSVYALWNDNLL